MEKKKWYCHAGKLGIKLGQNHIVISQLVQKYQQTNDVNDWNHPGYY